MCCFFTLLVVLGPRFAILVWWIYDPARWDRAFSGWLWPLLGFVFLPWTTLMYVTVRPGTVTGIDWLWLGLAFLIDLLSYSGGGYGNRNRVPGYSTSPTSRGY